MSIIYTKPETANVLSHDGENILIEGVVASTGVVDGIKITSDVLKSSMRWLNGRAIKLGTRKIGQVDEISLLNGQKISVKGTLWGLKLSQEELYSFKPGETNISISGAFWATTKSGDGVEEATSLDWDHILIKDTEKVGQHAAEGKWERLERLNMQMDSALGRC
ncbi:MAG: hypothetical protein QUS09_04065 [Methanotrichaceae archaeon]|nr:hypothetical protein [Methanotrichaceae archaeon]